LGVFGGEKKNKKILLIYIGGVAILGIFALVGGEICFQKRDDFAKGKNIYYYHLEIGSFLIVDSILFALHLTVISYLICNRKTSEELAIYSKLEL